MEGKQEKKRKSSLRPSTTFKVGAIALAFLIIGYQAALFVHRAAVTKIAADKDEPDTVYVVDEKLARSLLSGQEQTTQEAPPQQASPNSGAAGKIVVKRSASHSTVAEKVYSKVRRVESFRFNPNTASIEDLQRLGFSEKQAAAIDNYRSKGGRFRRKSDFAKSFVVADSVYERLEPFIDIPLLDINAADSAAFDELPGIGPYFAAKIVALRKGLHGFSCKEQLMDVYNFDKEKFDGLSDLIRCSEPAPFPLWSAPLDTLRTHPYIRNYSTARAIIIYRENNPPEKLTIAGLRQAGIVSDEQAEKLSRCKFR